MWPRELRRRLRLGSTRGRFLQVKVGRGEVGVGGVVFVEEADGGVAEEDGSAAVGLEGRVCGGRLRWSRPGG